MITLHRLNGSEFCINCDHIELIEETPDTQIMLSNDRRYIVVEKKSEIIDMIIEFKRRVYARGTSFE